MKHLLLFLSLFIPLCVLADDDYDRGETLYEQGRYAEALKAFGRSAHAGNSDAQYQIGLMFMEGQGIKANPKDAAYWWRKAAQNGHASSQYEIARCFEMGTGVQSDLRIAAEWYWRAAEQGDPDAALAVARMYRDGRGMGKNLTKARKYFQTAARAGLPQAQAELKALPKSTKTK